MPKTHDIAYYVSYDGDLLVAANEVAAELDDRDGLVVGTKAFRQLVREKARQHRVSARDLLARVMEVIDDSE